MLGHKYLSILNFIFMIHSCKCQDLDKYVAPILDNRGAPLVAIVDTTNISSHIVRSIEMPLRKIINTTIECKINEELETVKQDIATLRIDTEETFSDEIHERKNFTKIVNSVKADLDEKVKKFTKHVDVMKSELQQKIDKHIRDNRDQFREVKQNITTLQKNTIETISHEILGQRRNMTKTIDNVNKDLVKKMKNFTSNVILMQSGVQKKIDGHIGDNQNQFTELKQDIAKLRKEMEEKIDNEILQKMKNFTTMVNTVNKVNEKMKNLTNNVEVMQSELREIILSENNNALNLSEQLETHSNRLDALRSNIQELTVNTNAIHSGMNEVRSTANVNSGRLGGHESRLDDLNAKVNTINSRALFTASPTGGNIIAGHVITFKNVKIFHGINNLSSLRKNGIFTVEKEGYYLISCFVNTNSASAEFGIMQNSHYLGTATKHGDGGLETHSATITAHLNVGDIVKVQAVKTIWVDSAPDSMFTVVQII